MHYPTLTRQQLADLRGVKAQTVSKAQLPKETDGRYSLKNKEVRDWFLLPFATQWEHDYKRKTKSSHDDEPTDLDDKKTHEQIIYLKKQGRKLDLQHSKDKKDLHPTHLVAEYIGYIAAGMSTNLLNIGNRVARGDIALRDKIEKEIERGIQKSKEYAAANLKIAGEKMIEELEEK